MKPILVAFIFILFTGYSYSQKTGCISGNCEDGYGTFVFGSDSEWKGDKYIGYFKNGTYHGEGTYFWASGEKYEGNWANGLQSGLGTYTAISGKTEYGVWKDGELVEAKTKTNVSNNSKSTGCISGDCENGYGTYVWTEGDKYSGYWKNGEMDGQGTYNFTSGSSYVGDFTSGMRNGKGTYVWADGEKYIGDWKNDKQHGVGTYYYTDGRVEKGIYENGEYKGSASNYTGCITGDCSSGTGTYVWKNGEKYEGSWSNNKRNGQGTMYYTSGDRYTGAWTSDMRQGYGTMYYVDGEVKAGVWEDDRYIGSAQNSSGCISGNCETGYGVYVWDNGERYEGNWANGKRNGQGTNVYKNGSMFTGIWKDDQQHGYGTFTYIKESDFDKYMGDYISHKATGYGTLLWKSGQKYVGQFKEGYFHGEGTMYYKNGTVEAGLWEYDKFKGKKELKSGCIAGDCVNGFGTKLYDTGDKYMGTFKNEILEGQGTFTFISGDEYVGQFKGGTYHGQGTYTYSTGQKYVGEFAEGSFEGYGTMYYMDGTEKSGIWKENNYMGAKTVNVVAKPQISWLNPQVTNSQTTAGVVNVKICVKSSEELQNVQIYVNDKLQINNATRGYGVVTSECDFTIEKGVTLNEGPNTLKVVVTNSAGSTESTIRNIEYTVESEAIGEKRLALVIGNANYTASPLRNPANDAKLIAAELKKLGFEVMVYTDLGQNEMKTKIREFGTKLSKDRGVGLFYFAGHGLQLNGENYLVPVDAQIEKEQDVEMESVNLKRILGEMDYAQNDLNIVILDACRNNPFARSFRSSGSNGLATTIAPQGTFIAYATAPGSVASDGEGQNGLYTEELVKAIQAPSVKIEDLFKKVRQNVFQKSNKQQVPWENSSIFGDFYFKK